MKKDITVTKIDKDTGKPMQGVVFEATLDGRSIGYFTTGPDGSFTIPYADSGTYIFREYHTLARYELNRGANRDRTHNRWKCGYCCGQ